MTLDPYITDDDREQLIYGSRGGEGLIGLDVIDEDDERDDKLKPEKYGRALRRNIGKGLASVRRCRPAP